MVAVSQEVLTSQQNLNAGEESRCYSNPISRLFFCWLLPLIWVGRSKQLTSEDLGKTLDTDLSEELGDDLETNWYKEITRANTSGRKPSFLRAIFWTFISGYMLDGVLLFFQGMVCKTFQPVLLALLISQFASGSQFSRDTAYIYMGGLVILSLIAVLIQHHVVLRTGRTGMKIRVACCSLMYRKTLKLSSKALGATTAGQVVNLMSNDVNRFDIVMLFLHSLWIMPFQVILTCFILYLEVNVAAIVGVVCVTLQTVPLQSYLSKLSSKLRMQIARKTDERVRLMSEIISGIQVIKMYAWEKPFELMVSAARKTELASIIKASGIRAINMGSIVFTDRASLYVTLLTYSLLGYPISAAVVFSLAQFYNKIQEALAIQYPNAMILGAECLTTVRRIQEYLLLEERHTPSPIENLNVNALQTSGLEHYSHGHISMNNVSASWSSEKVTLNEIDLNIDKGKLYAVIGSVGAGKSSLLQLILRELPLLNGSLQIHGELSYACQKPWLFVDSIRNNILFGQKLDKERYNKVVQVCGLEPDFQQFPRGDQSLVGERGISLSGGQRARINLARAVYRQADIYLLDDPLSAVDTHVGRHLFESCVQDYLKDKTRILVTHQVHYLKTADVIIILEDGEIQAMGTYSELTTNSKFSNFLSTLQDEESEAVEDKKVKKQISTLKLGNNEGLEDDDSAELETAEEMETGIIKAKLYWQYFKAGGNVTLVFIMIFMMFFGQLTATSCDYWVTFWSNQKVSNSTNTEFGHDPSKRINIWDTIGQFTTVEYLYIYSILILSCVIFVTVRSLLFYLTCIKSSKGLHDQMFHRMLRVKMRFFDENPSGRILNRFSKDMGAMDELLPRAALEAVQISLVFCSIMVLVAITNAWLLMPIVIVIIFFHKMLDYYLYTAQNIKRLENTSRSPVFSHVSASLNGITTIRAFKSEQEVAREFDIRQNLNTTACNQYLVCGCTLGFWLDIMCLMFLSIVGFSFVYFNDGSTSAGNVGLALSQTLILMGMLQHGVRQATEVIAQMTSVERIIQYTKLEVEEGLEKGVIDTPDDWPTRGAITFRKTYLSYKENDPPVLKNLNFSIKSGWKVGIVGRTGAGKSSLISALFRLADMKGEIIIDDIDIKDISLHDVRSNISIIPQEPVLFSASLRYNLDPFKKFNDVDLWAAIEAVELKNSVTLNYHISEGGSNLSIGQRQLICLARAILRKNQIIVLDEATANVDLQTDSFIQKTIREKFPECTVLTIAHRLNTIMDSDRVLVMNDGKVVEYEHPHILLQNPEGYLYKMVKETESKVESKLIEIAKDAYVESYEKLHN